MAPDQETDTGTEKAGRVIDHYTKLLITLATGVVALSATFLSNFYRGHDVGKFTAAWVVLGVSVVAGIFARGAYIAQLAESNVRPRQSLLELFSIVQWTTLVAGVVLLTLAVRANLDAGPTLVPLRARLSVRPGGTALLPLACRTEASTGCTIRTWIVASAEDGLTSEGPRAATEIASDTQAHATIKLPSALLRYVTKHQSARATLGIEATGRNETVARISLPVTFVARHQPKPNPSHHPVRQRRDP